MKVICIELEPTELPDRELSPEQCLLVAVFERALRDYLTPSVDVAREDVRSAYRYFNNLETREYGSFMHFCEYLELDSKAILRVVRSGDVPLLRKKNGRKKIRTVRKKRS